MLCANLNSTIFATLLREWAKSTLASSEWKDALVATNSVSISFCSDILCGPDILVMEFMVPRFTIYRTICEHLESIDRTTDAYECFRQMVREFAEQTHAHHEQAEWVLGKRCRTLYG